MSTNGSELYKRQSTLGLRIPHSVAIVGCGGVGSWVALYLTLAGVKELWLYDHDTVDEHNLNRTIYLPTDVGEHKVYALRRQLAKFRPTAEVYTIATKFNPETAGMVKVPKWVVVATDNVASRRDIYQWAQDKMVSYIEVAAEGEIGSVTGEPAAYSTPTEEQEGYREVPVWVGPAVMAAAMATNYILHNRELDDTTIRQGWVGKELQFYNSDYEVTEVEQLEEGVL